MLFYTPDMALAAGCHAGVAEKNYKLFWEPRYQLGVPEGFVEYVYPFITDLDAAAEEMEAKKLVIPSVRSMIAALYYIAPVLWQDTIDMAYTGVCFDEEKEVSNPCIKKIMQHPNFQKELLVYTSLMDSKVSYFQ